MNLFDKYKTMARDTVTDRENIIKTPIDISSAEYSKSLKEKKNIPQVPLDNPSAEYSKTVMDIMKRKYSSLIQWLREYPYTDEDILDGATWRYVRLQDAITEMDTAMLAGDIQELDGGPDAWVTSTGVTGHAYYSFPGAPTNGATYKYPNTQEASPI